MVFYFTGTGNSLYIAKQLDSNVISIPQILKSDDLTFSDERIGIVCPIYGHEMPAMVKEFIKKATFDTQYFYVILTYGKMHGGAADLAEKYIKSVGKKANYIHSIIMVDNFLPAFDMIEQMKEDKHIDENLAKIKADIAEKKNAKQKVTLKDKSVHTMYTKMVKNAPETVWASYQITDDCIGCGICAKVCPAGCIKLEDQKAVNTGKNCQACYACVHACPRMAIQFDLERPEANPKARYRNEHIELTEIIEANNQTNY